MKDSAGNSRLYWEALADREDDSFQAYDLAKEHMDRILSAKPPFCYAITGPWGSGKSTFLRFMVQHLESRERAEKNIVHISFNAWKNSFTEDLGFVFLTELRRGIRRRLRFFPGIFRHPAIFKDLWAVGIAIALSLAEIGGGKLLGFFRLFLVKLLDLTKNKILGANAASNPTRLRKALFQLIQDLSAKNYKLIIFVDEIDRCPPPLAIQILETIRVFLFFDDTDIAESTRPTKGLKTEHELSAAFILSFDDDYIANAYAKQYGMTRTAAYRYIHKFFQFFYQMSSPSYGAFTTRMLNDLGSALPSTLERDRIVQLLNLIGARSTREIRLILVHFIDWVTRWFHIERNERLREALLMPEHETPKLLDVYYLFILEMCILKVMFPRIYVAAVRSRLIADLPRRQLSKEVPDYSGIVEYTESAEEALELQRALGEISAAQTLLLDGIDKGSAIKILRNALEVTLDY